MQYETFKCSRKEWELNIGFQSFMIDRMRQKLRRGRKYT